MKLTAILLLLTLSSILSGQMDQFRGSNRDGIFPDRDLLDQWPEEGPELLACSPPICTISTGTSELSSKS